jgi:uncharacterized protein (TIGR03435 family)
MHSASKRIGGAGFLLVAGAVLVAGGAGARGQAGPVAAAAAPEAVFEVASIRENANPGDGRTHIYRHPEDGQFVAVNASLRALLQFAFDLPDAQILNAPEMIAGRKYDVEAKAGSAVDNWIHGLDSDHAKLAKQQMVQALLAERFHLTAHQESRKLAVFALVAAKQGVKLQSAKSGASFSLGNTHITDEGASMAVLAGQLGRLVGRPVVDETGLAGRFDFMLQWSTPERGNTADAMGPSIFTALQEQLGLKLEPKKAPLPVLVVDHLEAPSDN